MRTGLQLTLLILLALAACATIVSTYPDAPAGRGERSERP